MTNPGGEHLGTRYEPVKAVYTAMLIGWMVLFTSLFIHIVTNLKVKGPTPIIQLRNGFVEI